MNTETHNGHYKSILWFIMIFTCLAFFLLEDLLHKIRQVLDFSRADMKITIKVRWKIILNSKSTQGLRLIGTSLSLQRTDC